MSNSNSCQKDSEVAWPFSFPKEDWDATPKSQIVTAQANPGYHRVLSLFRERTGIGGVLNTSFNIHGEPIVNTPQDALHTLDDSGLENLALGGWLVRKR